ncbi:hypothetical protein ACLOJK_024727 [Asimina triloba]
MSMAPFRFLVVLLHLIILIAHGHESYRRLPSQDSLHFSSNAPFKITLFADLHYGENAWTDWGPKQDSNSHRVMSTILSRENPDFVIYLGDVITANNVPIQNASLYWDQAISPTRDRGIPWASVFGNHDDASFEWPSDWFSATGIPQLKCQPTDSSVGEARNVSTASAYLKCKCEILNWNFHMDAFFCTAAEIKEEEEPCSFKGTSRLELMKKETQKNMLSHSSSGPRDLWPSVSNYVLPVLSSNFSRSAVALLYFLDSGGGSYPEVISSAQAYKEVAPWLFIWKPCVGSIIKESVAAQEAEWGMMDALVKRPSVKAVFVGHDHGLDWCCPYHELWLCYARHTGYGGYGNWARGARIIEMTEQPFSLKSWIRMEDGSKHSEILLAS